MTSPAISSRTRFADLSYSRGLYLLPIKKYFGGVEGLLISECAEGQKYRRIGFYEQNHDQVAGHSTSGLEEREIILV